jgi:hypothetical protein
MLLAVTSPPPTSDVEADQARRVLLREEVGRFRQGESRRVFDASVHVGVLAGPRTGFVARAQDVPALDAALKVEVVCALLEDSPDSWRTAWLVRPGTTERHDLDLQWLSALRTAFGVLDRPMDGCYVITRAGWRDLVTDESRTWARLRL